MLYNETSHITSVAEVELFFKHLVEDRNVSFHPDDEFEAGDGVSVEDAALWNRLMRESWSVCEKQNADIYDICLPLALGKVNEKLNEHKNVGDCFLFRNGNHMEFSRITDISNDGVVVAEVISVNDDSFEMCEIEYGKAVANVFPERKISNVQFEGVKKLYEMFLNNVSALADRCN